MTIKTQETVDEGTAGASKLTPSLAERLAQHLRVQTVFGTLSAIIAVVLAGMIFYPVVRLLVSAFTTNGVLDLTAFAEVTSAPWLPQVILNTVMAVTGGGLLALATASAFAWFNERTDARLGIVGDIMPLVPLLLPTIALAIGWILLAAERVGLINGLLTATLGRIGIDFQVNIASWPGLIFVYALYFIPYVYLMVSSALRNLDGSLEEASYVSGAGVFRTLRRISIPSIKPAMMGALFLVVMVGFSLYSVPVIIATQADIDILSVRIIRALTYAFPARPDEAVILSIFLLTMLITVLFFSRRINKTGAFARIGGKGGKTAPIRLGPWKWLARGAMILYLLGTSLLPILALLLVALQPFWQPTIDPGTLNFGHFEDVLFNRELTRSALRNSLLLGAGGGILGVILATVVGMYAMRKSHLGARIADNVTKLPATFSNIIIGLGFLIAFAGPPFNMAGTLVILLMVYVVVYMPQASIASGSALAQVGPELMEASEVSGASEGRTFRRIVFPLILPGLTGAWALVFVLITAELAASSLLAGVGKPVVGFVLLSIWEAGSFGPLAALAFSITLITSVVIGVVFVIQRRYAGKRMS